MAKQKERAVQRVLSDKELKQLETMARKVQREISVRTEPARRSVQLDDADYAIRINTRN